MTDEDQLAPAWDAARTQVELPVYFHWEFATGRDGDFETLADLLTGRARPRTSAGGRCARGQQPYQTGDPGRSSSRAR